MNEHTTVEWRVDDAGNIVLYLAGRPCPPPYGPADVRRARTQKLRRSVLAAIDEAMRLGAAHGTCDRTAEIGRTLSGQGPPPGCARYTSSRDNTTVLRRMDGAETVVVEGIRPYYLSGDISNTLDRAFRVGQRYGYQPTESGGSQ
jgi:hypothetical protein